MRTWEKGYYTALLGKAVQDLLFNLANADTSVALVLVEPMLDCPPEIRPQCQTGKA